MKKSSIRKYTIVLALLLVSVLVFTNFSRIESYFVNEKYYKILVFCKLLKPCYIPDYKNFQEEGLDYKQEDTKVVKDSLVKLDQLRVTETNLAKIPLITHRIYFVPKDRIDPLEHFYIEELKLNFNNLNKLSDSWEHNIWINKKEMITAEITNIKGVRVRDLSEISDNKLYPILLDLIEKGAAKRAHFSEASDVLRFILLEKFGGVYMDMDYELYDPKTLVTLMQNFDFFGGRESNNNYSFYGSSFLASKPNHPILNRATELLRRNYGLDQCSLPNYVKYPCSRYEYIYNNAPPLITLAYFERNNLDGNNDIILPSWMVFNKTFARLKNQHCDYSQITKESFAHSVENLSNLMENYISGSEFGSFYNNNNPDDDNIYYSITNIENRKKYPIIGADMFCGTWVGNGKLFRKNYYWNF